MLSCSGDNLTIPHDPDPMRDNVLALVGGHLDVHSPAVLLVLGWHFRVSITVPEAAYFGFVGVYCSSELVDMVACFGEALVSDGSAVSYCQDEAVCDGTHGVSEVVVLHAEDCLSQARGYRGVVPDAIGGDSYTEQGWGH